MKKFGFFYYSPKMREMQRESRDVFNTPFHHNFARQVLTGKVVEYNEWVTKFPFLPSNKWGDNQLVAIGWYHHSAKDDSIGLQGRDAKEYIEQKLRGH